MISEEEKEHLYKLKEEILQSKGDLHDFKYIDQYDRFLNEKQHVIKVLKLDRSSGKKILDIGTGTGLMNRLLKDLGHSVIATDCDWEGHDHDFFKTIRNYLGVGDYTELVIKPFKKMKIKGKFDYIIAVRSVFDGKWTIKEYNFWFKDVCSHLKDDGVLYVKTNFIKGKNDDIINDLLLFEIPSSDKGYSFMATKDQLRGITKSKNSFIIPFSRIKLKSKAA